MCEFKDFANCLDIKMHEKKPSRKQINTDYDTWYFITEQSVTLATSLKSESSRNYVGLVKAPASLARQSEPPPPIYIALLPLGSSITV